MRDGKCKGKRQEGTTRLGKGKTERKRHSSSKSYRKN